MGDDLVESLKNKYFKTFPPPVVRTKKLFLIGLVGLPGSGKSTVARMLSEKTGLYIASNDHIRRFLNQNGFIGAAPVQEILQKIAEANTLRLYSQKISHILDADIIKFIDAARKRAFENDAAFILIKIECNESEILKRIACRAVNDNQLSQANEEEYYRRKKVHGEINPPTFDFILKTDLPLESQLNSIINILQTKDLL